MKRPLRRVLVTGGAGYVGSHACKVLAARGVEPVVYDNLSCGHRRAVRWGPLVVGDVLDRERLETVLRKQRPAAVMHFAASAYVGESVAEPAKYYRNNVEGSLTLLAAMRAAGVGKLVFSSTCAVYGTPAELPIGEDAPRAPISPYGRSKLAVEHAIEDYAAAYGLRFALLRYFNAAGADPEGEIGEWHEPETHLIPRALMAAAGEIERLTVFGDDHPTPDGTCVRDYIHVTDLADAHWRALQHLDGGGGNLVLNLGTGRGFSVRDVLEAVERVTGRRGPVLIEGRRAGDPPALYADPARARAAIAFDARHSDLETIIGTAWRSMPSRVLDAAAKSVAKRDAPLRKPTLAKRHKR